MLLILGPLARDDIFDRHRHVDGDFGLVAVEQQTIPVKTPAFENDGIEDGQARPAHEQDQRAQAERPVFEVPASFPLAICIRSIDNPREFSRREVIGWLLRHPDRFHFLGRISQEPVVLNAEIKKDR